MSGTDSDGNHHKHLTDSEIAQVERERPVTGQDHLTANAQRHTDLTRTPATGSPLVKPPAVADPLPESDSKPADPLAESGDHKPVPPPEPEHFVARDPRRMHGELVDRSEYDAKMASMRAAMSPSAKPPIEPEPVREIRRDPADPGYRGNEFYRPSGSPGMDAGGDSDT